MSTEKKICMHCGKEVLLQDIKFFAYRPICQECYKSLTEKNGTRKPVQNDLIPKWVQEHIEKTGKEPNIFDGD